MYSINPLPMAALITPDEVMRFHYGDSLDPNIYSAAIFATEQRFIVPILGYTFYNQLCAQKNITVTTGNIAALQPYFSARNIILAIGDMVNAVELPTMTLANQLLWNNVLWPFLAECVKFTALPSNYAKFTTTGIIKNNPNPSMLDNNTSGTSAGISLNDLKYLRDNILLQNISVMTDAMERFLCANASSYPLLPKETTCKWNTDGKRKDESRKTGLVFIYDEDEYDCDDSYCQAPAPAPMPLPQYRACTLVVKIVESPDATHTLLLCNLQTIALEYPVGPTLTIPHLVGKTVNPVIQVDNSMPFLCPYNASTGTFDNTLGGGFNESIAGGGIVINYNEII